MTVTSQVPHRSPVYRDACGTWRAICAYESFDRGGEREREEDATQNSRSGRPARRVAFECMRDPPSVKSGVSAEHRPEGDRAERQLARRRDLRSARKLA